MGKKVPHRTDDQAAQMLFVASVVLAVAPKPDSASLRDGSIDEKLQLNSVCASPNDVTKRYAHGIACPAHRSPRNTPMLKRWLH